MNALSRAKGLQFKTTNTSTIKVNNDRSITGDEKFFITIIELNLKTRQITVFHDDKLLSLQLQFGFLPVLKR